VTGPTDLRARIARLQEELRRRFPNDDEAWIVSEDVSALLEELEVTTEELLETSVALEENQLALTRERERWRQLFEFAPDAYAVTDADGLVLEANEAARAMLAMQPNYLRRPLVTRLDQESRVPFLRLLREPPDTTDPAPIVVRLRRPPSDNFRGEIRRGHIGTDRYLWLIRDVTVIEEAAERLRASIEQERQVSRQLREFGELRNAFLLVVSHDLRAPLATIAGLATLLNEAHIDDAQRRWIIDRLELTSATTIEMLNDLLDYQRLAYGAASVQREEVDLGGLIGEVVERSSVSGRHLRVTVPSMTARLDPGLTRRIVANLLNNAVQHTPPAATIWIRARREPDGILLVVEDDGPGIPASRRAAIFDLFAREPNEGTGRLGVGLAVVARFAEAHGGYARAEARTGGGARFLVLLPEGPDDQPANTPPPGPSARAVRSTARS
jgi:signal transduction histidine kinase